MKYTTPKVTGVMNASRTVLGSQKGVDLIDNDSSSNPMPNTAPAYEADE